MTSIQFIGFDNEHALVEAIYMVLRQRGLDGIELNVCNPSQNVDCGLVMRMLRAVGVQEPIRQANQTGDELGILNATGEYIALCYAGDIWLDDSKLIKQIKAIQETNGCVLSTHDVELLNKDGYPCDQSFRNKYMALLGYEDRVYGVEQFERSVKPGLPGTWVFSNIFRNAEQQEMLLDSALPSELCVLGMLVCYGRCVNLTNQRLTSCQFDEEEYKKQECPQYDRTEYQLKVTELERLKALFSRCGVRMDTRYRLIAIANGVFNAFSASKPTEDSVALFMEAYQAAYREEYDDEFVLTAEQGFFVYLNKKVQRYELKQGTPLTLPLSVCFRAESDQSRIRWLTQRQISRALKEEIVQQAKNPEILRQTVRSKKRPWNRVVSKVKNLVWRVYRKVRNVVKRIALRRMRRRGFSFYMANEWFETVCNNLLHDHQTPLKRKLWCYRAGFMPWRIEQYGLTENNYREVLSDRDYMYLHQINNSYKKWIEDKMTFRYVFEPFKQFLPKYYFQIIQRDDKQVLLKLQDCPVGYETTFDDMFRLLREKGKLAFKSASGTHGVGFYKVEYRDEGYFLNNKRSSEYSLRKTIDGFRSFYIVTEYVTMHDEIKKLYPESVNTIRILMLNRDGHHPQILDAYMRIGSVSSGVTDNVAYGGIVCSIDVDTGEYYDGLQLVDHNYVSVGQHPDTGTKLCGTVPHWEVIKQGIKDISNHISQLEYLGFDVVCTPDSFTILEVNSHQDLHRFPSYDQRIKDFYFYKLDRKKRRYRVLQNKNQKKRG